MEEEGVCTREKKRREFSPAHQHSTHMDLPLMSSGIWSDDDSKLQFDATTQLLNLVSVENKPLIGEVIQSGAVPRLVEFLKRDDYPQLQCVAARILKNIAFENTQVVIDFGAVPVFVRLLQSSDLETCEQVVWSLGNIAGESSVCRDIVLDCGALHPLLTLLEQHKSLSFLRIGTWTLTNIFEGGPKVPFEQLEFAIRVLASFMVTTDEFVVTTDELVLKEACWAVLYLSHCGGGIETAMYEADLCEKLGTLFKTAPLSVMYPAVRAVRSILTGNTTVDERAFKAKRVLSYRRRKDLVSTTCIDEEAACIVNFVLEASDWIIYKIRDDYHREHKLYGYT